MKSIAAILTMLAALGATAQNSAGTASAQYQADTQKWRQERERDLRENWLTLVGLWWLKEGENTLGSDQDSDIALPKGAAPARVGVIELRNGKARLRVEPGVAVKVNGKAAGETELKPDASGDKLTLGSLTMFVIERGERLALRVRDANSAQLRQFKGLEFFPLSDAHQVSARFVAAEKKIPVPNVLGQVQEYRSPGYVEFTLAGQTLRLEPVVEGPEAKELFFIFRDGTSGQESYPAGRFLYSELPRDGKVTLDFNRAYSPPCAFTPYATCPLPPKSNWLKARIEAGEKYKGH